MNWDFRVRGYAGGRHPKGIPVGSLLLETVHKGEASAAIEIECWQERMCRGEVSHAELIDLRYGGRLTNLQIYAETKIMWSYKREGKI